MRWPPTRLQARGAELAVLRRAWTRVALGLGLCK